jgi:hypothetical protein
MKYNQPYGISDPDAGYINGNPSTGTMGSIPPAASIEEPQREIVNLITHAGIVPAGGDMHQLAKAVQSGKLIFAPDTGAANQIALNCAPVVTALQMGMVFITKIAATNTGPTIATVNGVSAPVVHSNDSTPLLAFDVNAGQMSALCFDGANFQLVWSANAKGLQGVLEADIDIYVDSGIGSDTLYDGTSATISGTKGPFQTIQHAVDVASKLNANGFIITIRCADGAYTPFSVTNVTNGGLWVKGNTSAPALCTIHAASGAGVLGTRGVGVGLFIEGFKLSNSEPVGGNLMVSQVGAHISYRNIDFSFASGSHMFCDGGGMDCFGSYTISGNANTHITVQYGEFILTPSTPNTITIAGSVGMGYAFVLATGVGFIRANTNTTFSGAVTTGSKFSVKANAVIDTSGAGVNFFPGTTPGTNEFGGVYV